MCRTNGNTSENNDIINVSHSVLIDTKVRSHTCSINDIKMSMRKKGDWLYPSRGSRGTNREGLDHMLALRYVDHVKVAELLLEVVIDHRGDFRCEIDELAPVRRHLR